MKYPGGLGELIADPFVRGGGWHLSPELAWQRYAACAQPCKPMAAVTQEADRFVPGGGGPSKDKKELCLRCPVREPRLNYALANEEQSTWGGLTEQERKTLRHRRTLDAETTSIPPGGV